MLSASCSFSTFFFFLPGTKKGIKNGTATGFQLTLERRGKKIRAEMALLVPSDHHSSLSKATSPRSLLSPLKSRQGQGTGTAARSREGTGTPPASCSRPSCWQRTRAAGQGPAGRCAGSTWGRSLSAPQIPSNTALKFAVLGPAEHRHRAECNVSCPAINKILRALLML